MRIAESLDQNLDEYASLRQQSANAKKAKKAAKAKAKKNGTAYEEDDISDVVDTIPDELLNDLDNLVEYKNKVYTKGQFAEVFREDTAALMAVMARRNLEKYSAFAWMLYGKFTDKTRLVNRPLQYFLQYCALKQWGVYRPETKPLLYERVNHNGVETFAYRPVKREGSLNTSDLTLEDAIRTHLSPVKEYFPELKHGIMEAVLESMQAGRPQCPLLDINRYYISFINAVIYINEPLVSVFATTPSTRPSQLLSIMTTKQAIDQREVVSDIEGRETCSHTFFPVNVDIEVFEAVVQKLDGDGMDGYEKGGWFELLIDRIPAVREYLLRHTMFRNAVKKVTDEEGNTRWVRDDTDANIALRWFFAMCGRLMFTNKTANYVRMLYIIGAAGTGKSSFLNLLIAPMFINTLTQSPSTASSRFSLSGLGKTDLVLMTESDGKLPTDTATWKSLSSHETVAVEEKFKDTVQILYEWHSILLSNRPLELKDDGGAISDRLAVVEFDYVYRDTDEKVDDSVLEQRYNEERPYFIAMITTAFAHFARHLATVDAKSLPRRVEGAMQKHYHNHVPVAKEINDLVMRCILCKRPVEDNRTDNDYITVAHLRRIIKMVFNRDFDTDDFVEPRFWKRLGLRLIRADPTGNVLEEKERVVAEFKALCKNTVPRTVLLQNLGKSRAEGLERPHDRVRVYLGNDNTVCKLQHNYAQQLFSQNQIPFGKLMKPIPAYVSERDAFPRGFDWDDQHDNHWKDRLSCYRYTLPENLDSKMYEDGGQSIPVKIQKCRIGCSVLNELSSGGVIVGLGILKDFMGKRNVKRDTARPVFRDPHAHDNAEQEDSRPPPTEEQQQAELQAELDAEEATRDVICASNFSRFCDLLEGAYIGEVRNYVRLYFTHASKEIDDSTRPEND